MKMTLSDMYCTQCGRKNIPVRRNAGKEREAGHLKNMYCIYCNKETNMVEIRDFGRGYTIIDFELEYTYHNFNEDGSRVMPYKEFLQKIKKEGVFDKKNDEKDS